MRDPALDRFVATDHRRGSSRSSRCRFGRGHPEVAEVLDASPSTPKNLAAVVDAATDGYLNEAVLSVLVEVLADGFEWPRRVTAMRLPSSAMESGALR
jgi:hypothetical protein